MQTRGVKSVNGKPVATVANDDLLAGFEAAEPEARKSGPRERAPFVVNPDVLAAVTAALVGKGAFTVNRRSATPKIARTSAKPFIEHAWHALATVEALANKSLRITDTVDSDKLCGVKVSLTHKRTRKENSDTPTAE